MRRSGWTDPRLDDKMGAIDSTFDMLHEEIHGVRTEIQGLRSDFAALQTTLVQIGFGLVGVLLAAMLALIVALA